MASLSFTHPLQWPNGFPRTQKWEKSVNPSFKVGLSIQEALTFLYEELKELNVSKATLCTDYENIEQPRGIRRVGSDDGAALAIEMNGQSYRMACDRWVGVEQNVYALHLALRSLRNIVLWGVGNLEDVFGGYTPAALQARQASRSGTNSTAPGMEEWRLVLGLGPTATIEDAQAVYRRRAKTLADKPDELMKLNLAMDAASKALAV
jgi:hypothetical protein